MPAPKRTKTREPAAGGAAPPLHGGYYAIRPGTAGNSAEYFAASLDGLNAAAGRAAWLSVSTGQQEVSVTRGRARGKVLFRYDSGVCTLRPSCLIPAAPAPRQAS